MQRAGLGLSQAGPEATPLLHHMCGFLKVEGFRVPLFLQMLSSGERWEDGNVPDRCVGEVGSQSGRGPWSRGPWVYGFRELDPGVV